MTEEWTEPLNETSSCCGEKKHRVLTKTEETEAITVSAICATVFGGVLVWIVGQQTQPVFDLNLIFWLISIIAFSISLSGVILLLYSVMRIKSPAGSGTNTLKNEKD